MLDEDDQKCIVKDDSIQMLVSQMEQYSLAMLNGLILFTSYLNKSKHIQLPQLTAISSSISFDSSLGSVFQFSTIMSSKATYNNTGMCVVSHTSHNGEMDCETHVDVLPGLQFVNAKHGVT